MTCTCYPSSPFHWQQDPRPSIFADDPSFKAKISGKTASQISTEVVKRKRDQGIEVGTIYGLNKERDEAFFAVNGLLLRNTSVVNMLDGCALSLPMHVAGELPSSLMVWQGPMHDDTVLNISLTIEDALRA